MIIVKPTLSTRGSLPSAEKDLGEEWARTGAYHDGHFVNSLTTEDGVIVWVEGVNPSPFLNFASLPFALGLFLNSPSKSILFTCCTFGLTFYK